MVERMKFTNSTGKEMDIVLEPSTESFILATGETIVIELTQISNVFNDEFALVLESSTLFIYESRQCHMRVYANGELKYYTPPDMPKI